MASLGLTNIKYAANSCRCRVTLMRLVRCTVDRYKTRLALRVPTCMFYDGRRGGADWQASGPALEGTQDN